MVFFKELSEVMIDRIGACASFMYCTSCVVLYKVYDVQKIDNVPMKFGPF
jgi:hypothetical protein